MRLFFQRNIVGLVQMLLSQYSTLLRSASRKLIHIVIIFIATLYTQYHQSQYLKFVCIVPYLLLCCTIKWNNIIAQYITYNRIYK